MAKELLPKKSENISEWYTSVIRIADLADYGPVKGTMIIKPYGYSIWEAIQKQLDGYIKEKGVKNAYFPLFIPMSFLEKEQSHVEGFSPELAVVTVGGGEKLEEPLVVRPTSETVMYDAYSKWIQSWRDLPLMMNQWCNIVRWEKRTMPFMRTSEFLWQEGHTAHANHEEAIEAQNWAMDAYSKIYRDLLAIDGYTGYKSITERFAGAVNTLTFEALMPSGKVVQSCTSHDLGQNFSKVFNIKFQDEQGTDSYVWQTSWGYSTRSIAALILAHGDDNGLCLPPRVAPVQVAIVPAKLTKEVMDFCVALNKEFADNGIRSEFDNRDDETFGYKLNKWEVRGAPVVVKVGPREVENGNLTCRRRDTLSDVDINRDGIVDSIAGLFEEIQSSMLSSSTTYKDENTRSAANYDEFKDIMKQHKGFIKVFWNDDPEIEKKIKEETTATTRCKIAEDQSGIDFYTGKPAKDVWLFAQSY
ncbi:proline--tRNA ligase [Candidatus Saccharibacteria bacterium]|nr:proline--tRNA ligase [Candidatus Saccharibacteria bacterium]